MAAPDAAGSAFTLFASNATRAALDELLPQFERTQRQSVRVSYDPAQIMLKRIADGELADVAILNQPAIDALAKQGKIVPDSRRTLARCCVGIAVRAGAPKPDVSSVEAFKRAMLEAQSIAHTTHGASGVHFSRIVEVLGIADDVKRKAVTNAGGLIGELVARGKAELAIQQIPELMAVPGIELVGPLPQDLQSISVITGGVFITSTQHVPAQALLEFLTAPLATRVFRAKGLEPA